MSSLNNTIGALNIGAQISFLLLGTLVVQAHNYYMNYPHDPKLIKALVGIVLFFEIIHGGTVAAADYTISVINYGNPKSLLGKTPLTLDLWIFFSGFIGPMVQAFFARRILVISGSWYIPLLCWFLSFARFLGSLGLFYGAVTMKNLGQFDLEWRWCLTSVLVIGALTDTVIAVTLCILLQSQRQTALPKTARLLNKLIAWTIQTGLITSITGIIMLIFFLTFPHTFIWLGIFEVLPRMFSNSLLASLNARSNIRGSSNSDLSKQSTMVAKKDSRSAQSGKLKIPITIEMTRVQDATKTEDIESNSVVEASKVDLDHQGM